MKQHQVNDTDDSAANLKEVQALSKLDENKNCADCGVQGKGGVLWCYMRIYFS